VKLLYGAGAVKTFIEAQHRSADGHPETDGKLLGDGQQAVAAAGIVIRQIGQGNGISWR
jgi:hypothetical protein